jgi:3-hydroxyacyl-CoA dehydrogenase/enoyl-CoA hydratase/3-hydroxybutyryl-CoA epimerase
MRAEAEKAAPREHYPAPHALIDLWETHGGDRAAMLAAEKTSFARLMVTPTAQNLIRVFFLREQMKKLAGSGNKVAHVHVIGAGAMGGDIAAWCANQGLRVTLADMKPEPVAGAIKRASDLFGKIMRKGTEIRDALDRLMPDMDGEGVRNADLIIEAVPEKLELKQKVYAGLEPRMKPGAILATNTSSIPLQDLRTTLARPERLVGLHFFNPVSRLQLVEVVSHDGSDPEVMKQALAFVGAIDRLPLPVKSSPGFLVNRALTPYMLEAMVMLDQKIDKSVIDAAAKKFGMPMGPIELADQVGLDICLAVGDMLRSKFGDALPPTPAWLREKVARGELGRKTGKGFYIWKDGKADKSAAQPQTAQPTDEMIDRLVLPMSNVCVAALREGIVDNADAIDGAIIFGTGYAPFRGGPLNYARSRGPENVVAALQALAEKFGDRFAPDAGWETFT